MSRHRRAAPLKWTFQQGLHFAHGTEGMWSIEQLRGKFLLRLRLSGTKSSVPEQDFGDHKSVALAKREADRAHRALAEAV